MIRQNNLLSLGPLRTHAVVDVLVRPSESTKESKIADYEG